MMRLSPEIQTACGRLSTIYAFIWIGFAVLVFTFIYLAGELSQRVQYDLRKRIFEHLQNLSLSYLHENTGWLDYVACDIGYRAHCRTGILGFD